MTALLQDILRSPGSPDGDGPRDTVTGAGPARAPQQVIANPTAHGCQRKAVFFKESIACGMYLDPQVGRAINYSAQERKGSGVNPLFEAKDAIFLPGDNRYGFSGNNPWSRGAAAQKTKTSKGGHHGIVRTIDMASP